MDKDLAGGSHADASKTVKIMLTRGAPGNRETMPEPGIVLEILKGLDWDIACSSEKLMNLDLCITDMSLGENDPKVFSTEKGTLSDEQSEKTLALDLSLSYLGSEVIELGNFFDSLQVEVVNVYEKMSLFESEPELTALFEESVGRLEASLKPLQQKLLEMKKQLGILQRIRSFGQKSSYMFSEEKYEEFKSKTADQQHFMLDVSVSSELNVAKKLAEFKKNEDELKSKLFMADQSASCIEAAAELTWLRLLEVENLAEVFKGMSNEMLSRLNFLQFSLNGSLQREAELKCQLQVYHEQLQGTKKDEADTYLSEVDALKEKVKLLEGKLEYSESMLRQANASNEASDQALFEMENFILSVRENALAAESRAEEAEAKVAELTEVNLELIEELGCLKGAEVNTEKVALLEKQARDLEKQLQQAKTSSENLYAAIWDMETLIGDLKSKASKAELRSETTEDKCLKLAETNSELNKEISYLKSRAESLQSSLKDIIRRKGASAKDINNGAKVITDMVMQLAVERERIQKQLYCLAKENIILMDELRKSRRKDFDTLNGMKEDNDSVKEAYSSVNGFVASESEPVEQTETSCTSNQVNELDAATSGENEESSTTSPDSTVNNPSSRETDSASKQGTWMISRRYILMAILLPVLTAAAMLVICNEEKFAALRHCLNL